MSQLGNLASNEYGYPTQRTLWLRAEDVDAFGFSRPEDVSTNPNNGQEFVLSSTGVPGTPDANGTVYTMTLDFSDINAPGGTLKVLYDGNDDPPNALTVLTTLIGPMIASSNVQEDDANGTLFGGASSNPNEASIVRINPSLVLAIGPAR